MNYQEARVYLEQIAKYGSVLGLENMQELLKRLHHPQKHLKFVHIAGTNGKGSTLAFISTILRYAGYETGTYCSPTVFSYREKIQVNGSMIQEEEFAQIITKIKQVIEQMEADGKPCPTLFEVETAAAFLYFQQQHCQIVVLETGLGGRLDATNVIEQTEAAVFTPISMDHMGFLGNTLEEIAREKAGIIKEGAHVVTTAQRPMANKVIMEQAKKYRCPVTIADDKKAVNVKFTSEGTHFSYGDQKDFIIGLLGTYQIQNAVLAIETINVLREKKYRISDKALYEGLLYTYWQGRFTRIHRNPLVIIDGAHNEAAAYRLSESLELYFKDRDLTFIMGIFKDKEYDRIIEITAPLAKYIITVETPIKERSFPVEELKEAVFKWNKNVAAAHSMEEAVELAFEHTEKEGVIVAFGSLSYLGELSEIIEMWEERGL